MKPVVQRLREILLAADPRIDECIKWQAPTFTFGGNLASFFPKSKQHASLMFHLGAKIPGTFSRLEGEGDTGRVMKIGSVEDANDAKTELEAIVKAWCTWREADAAPAGARSAKAKPKSKSKATPSAKARTKTNTKATPTTAKATKPKPKATRAKIKTKGKRT
ncbi:MAG: DUF1801 domain-containing protein [Deltaproteobacteria bacterium]|nr:DUF1801 domain-containing protein [Deltaproteobacteria bacterium]